MEEIKVKYFVDGIDELCYVEGKSDWIDLHAAEEVTLHAGEYRLIPLGVAMALPEGWEAIWPPAAPPSRISASCRPTPWAWWTAPTGETGTSGSCPPTPPGTSPSPKTPGSCQFRIMRNQPQLHFTRVEHLEGPDRGGFGSTGI